MALTLNHVEFPDGTNNWNHGQGLIARWQPAPGIEIVPFWTLSNDYDDEAGTFYVPAGKYLPPQPPPRRFDGPGWADYRYVATNHGLVASVAPAKDWLVRLGAFRSVFDQRTAYTNLLLDELPDGTGDRLTIADPHTRNVSLSGELRVTHSIAEGPRLHLIHLSLRERDARQDFGGSDEVDFGAGRLGVAIAPPEPAFAFTEEGHDRVRQATYGMAYDGRWKGVGEISFGISRADYRKTTTLPATPAIVSTSQPWLYNGTAAAFLSSKLAVYAGYSRGLEESGVAPPNAANRNQPLPAILTEQKDAGVRIELTKAIRAVLGVFDLRRPYFSYDSANRYTRIGSTQSRGLEFSVSGKLTPRLDMVAGGVIWRARVERDAATVGVIGPRPVGLPDHLVNLNLNWRAPLLDGLSFDTTLVHRGATPATTDNLVSLPPKARVDLGGRYRFKLSGHSATLRLQASNLFDNRELNIAGPGIYAGSSGRFLTGYLAVDI